MKKYYLLLASLFMGVFGQSQTVISYTSDNSWTVPAGITSVNVEASGGGGGGACSDFGDFDGGGSSASSSSKGNEDINSNNNTDPAPINISETPTVFPVTGGGSYCDGSGGLPIGLSGSQTGVTYQLYGGATAVGAAINGTDRAISFGKITTAGIYTVKAAFISGGNSDAWMKGDAEIVVNPVPPPIVITPSASTLCQGTILPISASGVPPGTSAVTPLTHASGNINMSIRDNNATGIMNVLPVTGIPVGATITSVSVNFDISHNNDGDLLINLKGPNNNILNIANGIGGGSANFTNTTVASEASSIIGTGSAPFSDTYLPNAVIGVAGAEVVTNNRSNVDLFSGLYDGTAAGANGNWTLSVRDKTASNSGTLNNWSLTINYTTVSNPVNVIWSPATDLYTDPGATMAYVANTTATAVYAKPSVVGANLYTAISTNSFGCISTATATLTVKQSPKFTMVADYCSEPERVVVTATSDIPVNENSWQWSGGEAMYGSGNYTRSIQPNTADIYNVTATSTSNSCPATASLKVAQELVVNGDFEAGNTGFVSGYNYVNNTTVNGLNPEGTYTVNNNPNINHSNFWGTDHTTANGNGNFLLVNGVGGTNAPVVWSQTVTVLPNTDYYFSAYATSLNNVGPYANLQFRVNGVVVGGNTGTLLPKPRDNNPGTWTKFYGSWPSGTATSAVIEIVDLVTEPNGNDFGIDDISFGTLSAFLNLKSGANTDAQTACSNITITTIAYEMGGKGDSPIISGLPEGLTSNWNGRDLLINGTPTEYGPMNYQIKIEVCENAYLKKNGTLNIHAPSQAGTFSAPLVSTCYNTAAHLQIEDNTTVGDILRWETSPDNSTWTTLTNTTDKLNTPALTNTEYYRVVAQNGVSCNPDTSTAVKVGIRNLWTGTSSTDWNTGTNWSDENTPALTCDNVVIPDVGSKPYPILSSGTTTVKNIVIRNNASLTIKGTAIMQIAGTITKDATGTFDAKEGTLEFNSTTAQQTISSSLFKDTTIKNLIVSNDAGLNVASTGKSLAITGKISFGSAQGQLNSGDNITLKSTQQGTASLGEVGASNIVSGKFTVERYINIGGSTGQHAKKWIFLATPARGQTVKQSWMENGNTPTGYGIQVTGQAGKGFDMTSPQPSVKQYDQSASLGWTGVSGANTPLYNPRGWMVFVRGDRSVDGVTNKTANNTNVRAKGTLTTGNTTFTLPALGDNFEPIGNPFASAINMKTVLGPGETFYIWDPRLGGLYGYGEYVSYTEDMSGEFVSSKDGSVTNHIQSGQAFFLQTSASPVTINIAEADKADSSKSNTFFRGQGSQKIEAQLRMGIYDGGDTTGVRQDGTLQLFSDKFINSVNRQDGRKMMNSGINLAVKQQGKYLSIERRQLLTTMDTISIHLTGLGSGQYTYAFDAQKLVVPGLKAWLEDTYTQTKTPVNLNGYTKISFTTTGDAASKAASRFRVIFKITKQVVVPVEYSEIDAQLEGVDILVSWQMAQEMNVTEYQVEKSVDGIHFSPISTVAASGIKSYSLTDQKAVEGYNYYRIHSLDKQGKSAYSGMAKVWMGSMKPVISVYPNPVQHDNINLWLKNQPKGVYGIRLFNPAGQMILISQVTVGGTNHHEKIKLSNKVAHGMYQLEVTLPDGSKQWIQVLRRLR